LADPSLAADVFKSPGAGVNHGVDMASWLIRAALARYVLAAFLAHQPRPPGLLEYLYGDFRRRAGQRLGASEFSLLLLALTELEAGRIVASRDRFSSLQGLYAQLTGVRATGFPAGLTGALQADPVGRLCRASGDGCAPDVAFVARSLAFLSGRP